MTISLRKYTTRPASFFVTFIIAFSLTSCFDNNIGEPVVRSYTALYHGSPNTGGVDIYYEENKVTTASFNYGGYSDYVSFDPGERTFGFSLFGTTTSVEEITSTFEENKFYSLFLAGESPNTEIIMLTDTSGTRITGKAHLRVINLSPDAGEIEVFIEANAVTTEPLDFKDATAFKHVDMGIRSIQIRDADTDDVLNTVNDMQLNDGKYYTLIIRGYRNPPSGNTNVLTGQLVANN